MSDGFMGDLALRPMYMVLVKSQDGRGSMMLATRRVFTERGDAVAYAGTVSRSHCPTVVRLEYNLGGVPDQIRDVPEGRLGR